MSELEKLLTFVPERYRPLASLLLCASPLISRAIYSVINGGGLKGIITSIWLGTNTPKKLKPLADAAANPTTENPS